MATTNPRIQVTVDDELAAALERVGTTATSRSRLVRDLALRGAQALEHDQQQAKQATELLLEIANGKHDHDFAAAEALAAARGERLP